MRAPLTPRWSANDAPHCDAGYGPRLSGARSRATPHPSRHARCQPADAAGPSSGSVQQLNQGQGGMCICRTPGIGPGIGLGIWQERFGPRLQHRPAAPFDLAAPAGQPGEEAADPLLYRRLQDVPHCLLVDLEDLGDLPPRGSRTLHLPGQLHLVVGEGPAASQDLAWGLRR